MYFYNIEIESFIHALLMSSQIQARLAFFIN